MRPPPELFTVGGLAAQRFESVGRSRGEIVIVHGAMDRAAGFRRVIRQLATYSVTTYDRRGYDGSRAMVPSERIADHVDDLLGVCGTCASPPLIVGHSQGGLLALHGIVGSGAIGVEVAGALVWEPPMPWFDWYVSTGDQLLDCSPAVAAERFMASVLGDRLWSRVPRTMRADRMAEGPALLADIVAARSSDAVVDLTAIDGRVVAAMGSASDDHHRRSTRTIAAAVPGCRLVEVDGASHGVHLSHPGDFAGIIAAWFAPPDPSD